jgi:MFS transporter, OCT family, solute carrier family 22 (organic cation transporter), member 4/5
MIINSSISISLSTHTHLKALLGLVEIPAIGIAMYIIMKTGKKWLFSATFLACGISLAVSAFCQDESLYYYKIAFVAIGKKS